MPNPKGNVANLLKLAKGQRAPGAGRKPGQQNRATVELKQLLSELIHDPEYQESLRKRAKAGKLAPALELGIVHLVGGKPIDRVEQGKPGDFKVMTDDELRAMMAKLALKMDTPKETTDAPQADPSALDVVQGPDEQPDAAPSDPESVH